MENDIVRMLFLRRQRQKKRWKIKTISGAPPLSFKAKAGALKDYRIYGNTAGGEAVGDLETAGEHAGEYKVTVTVGGKNLFDVTAQHTVAYETCYKYIISGLNPNLNYTCSTNYNQENHTDDGVYFCGSLTPANGVWQNKPKTYKPNNDGEIIILIRFIQYHESLPIYDAVVSGDIWIMVNEGVSPLPYEPYHTPVTTPIYLPEQIKKVGDEAEYIDYGEQKQHRVRKNLLPNAAKSQTINGITFIANSNGSIVCNGQASLGNAILIYPDFMLPSGTYILTGCPNGGSETETYKMLLYINGAWRANDKGSGTNFTITELSTVSVRIVIYSGYTCDNLTFYPMIRKADIEDDTYEPYIENTEVDVTLPELPTLAGTNVMNVGTAVQPSGVEITGRIKKGE